ncbi:MULTISPECIES: hypothetical protein [Aquimarina]|uniref:hypothetical protein n=1 Tax=Aquimarina TaxID=290174 RepID=UPI0009434932|nr:MULTISPECIES: hypothetical protein [Aquimarina]
MKIVALTYLSVLLLFLNSNAQTTNNENRMLHTIFKVIDAHSRTEVPLAIIEISSGNKRVGGIQTDFDGLSPWDVCSKKLVDHKFKINVFGMNYKPFEKTYSIKNDTILTIKLDPGEIKFKNQGEWGTFIRRELRIPFCGTGLEIDIDIEVLENAEYRHCDGRIKRFNDIPTKELHQWEKIHKQSTKKTKDEN